MFAMVIAPGIAVAQYPNGYTHRPVMELFTSTSCPPCMDNADPAIDELYAEEGDTDEQPWVFLAFHLASGGDRDDKFVTDEAVERSNHYQVQGTPTAEFDGGYISIVGADSGTKGDYDQAFDDCGARDDEFLSLSDFKQVIMYVHQDFDGTGFAVNVSIEYPFDPDDRSLGLDGTLQVFMVEDDIWAFSSALDETVMIHNVFRGYAIKDMQVQLNPDESGTFLGRWDIPADVEVPVDPMNVQAIAVLYDNDDTTSQRYPDGNNHAGSERAVQAATPRSTMYDLEEEGPSITNPTLSWNGKAWEVEARMDDDDHFKSAWVFYTTNLTENSTEVVSWQWEEMILPGECVGPVCDIYESGIAKGEIPLAKDDAFFIRFLAYDGNGTQSISDVYFSGDLGGRAGGGNSDSTPLDPTITMFALAVAVLLVRRRR
ncbi:MAG: hypothetical protein L0Z54_03070 [Thermoplasmata archaeon]|nr:hypothetical protein [Thermoplasmata archaeon]